MNPSTQTGPDLRNLIAAIVLATAVMIGWQYFYERPRQLALHAQQAASDQQKQIDREKTKSVALDSEKARAAEVNSPVVEGPRIAINSPALHGTIALTGAPDRRQREV